MARKIIEESWEVYRGQVIPSNAPFVQVNETKKAFYSGAAIMFQNIKEAMAEGEGDPTEEELEAGCNVLDSIQQEINEIFEGEEGSLDVTQH